MAYQLYRNTTLGNTLQESLDELIQFQQISPSLALRVLLQFDRAINQALANKVRARITFKASKLNTYRFCDNVWTFLMSEVEFKDVQEFAQVDKLKIVACDGRGFKRVVPLHFATLLNKNWLKQILITPVKMSRQICIFYSRYALLFM
ncbi:transcription initiation factor IIA subunit 2 isoform X1 [Palaemon carinicauda]|uniref:transcription initiation factor IIA subunit 2 isoform X1 n=1 Tax=Palaemon carinicauda TaxID=392227 RepID=UPI0035B571E7